MSQNLNFNGIYKIRNNLVGVIVYAEECGANFI